MDVSRLQTPIEPHRVDEVFGFWTAIFEDGIDVTPEVLLGHELPYTRITVFTDRRDGVLAGACLVVACPEFPSLGGYGEVATNPDFRRRGIAANLSRIARDDFAERGGEALFLGTGDPAAARIYFRLGWRKLAGADLMVNVLTGGSPEEFLVDHFRGLGPATIREPSPADRVPMIPLLVSPHDWQVLDANVAMFSTRYAVQGSCLGLYRRYSAIAAGGQGAWFCAVTDLGHVVGLSTARLDVDNRCHVDAFTHRSGLESWRGLVDAAADWGHARGASSIQATVSIEDEEKQSLFESIGFTATDPRDPFDLDGRQVAALGLKLA